ncbi:hypothetical protein N9P96_00765, partial [bacterium]|nr:hypothetical protein [bacterium]
LCNFTTKYLLFSVIRILSSILIFLVFTDYLLAIFFPELILLVLFYDRNKINYSNELSVNLVFNLLKKGYPFVIMLGLVPFQQFIYKFFGDFILVEDRDILKTFEIQYAVYSILAFLLLRPLTILLFPRLVAQSKKSADALINSRRILEKSTLAILFIMLIFHIILLYSETFIYIFRLTHLDFAPALSICLFTFLSGAHLYFLSSYYESGALQRLAGPFFIAIFWQVSFSYLAVLSENDRLLEFGLVTSNVIFYYLAILLVTKRDLSLKALILLGISVVIFLNIFML